MTRYLRNFSKHLGSRAALAGLAMVLSAGVASAQTNEKATKTTRMLDLYDRVELTFKAEGLTSLKDKDIRPPADFAEGKLIVFVPKIKDTAQGFWVSDQIRFASMSVKVGDYSFPMRGTSMVMQYIDDRPMKLTLGRAPKGREDLLPGTADFVLRLSRDSMSRKDFSLEFSEFAFSLFRQPDAVFISRNGTAQMKIIKSADTPDARQPDFGFSIGTYNPDGN